MDSHNLYSKKSLRLFLGLACLLLFTAQSVSGQEACPPPPNYVGNPLSTPSITAAEVAANPTADNLSMFASAGRDYLLSITTQVELAYLSCLMRQEGGDWRSGGIFPIAVSVNQELAVNPQAPINMRILFHASHMAYGGRLVKPEIAGAILLAASSDLSSGGPVPGLGGHAVLYGPPPLVMLVGLDLQEPHLDPKITDSHYIPQVTAREVVDRASLKAFVNEAIHYITQLSEAHGFEAAQIARATLRDPNGPWISGPVYFFIFDPVQGYTIFHGAFPDRYEYRVTGTARDAVTGELILPQILAAAEQEGGGFVEYHFDNPDDDSDSAEIPKVTYARKHTYSISPPASGETPITFIIAAGFYPGAGTGSGIKMTRSCADRGIAASAVQTLEDIQPFVECAAEYLAEHGAEEARRAFNEDERWKHGPTYVFVDGLAESGTDSQTFVYPPDPSREGQLWGEAIDDYGTDLFYEAYRIMSLVDSGWLYYSFPNPATGREVPKASYVIEIDWDGSPAVIGAGLYARDLPGTCYPDEVSAAVLEAAPSPQTLREFVRCAAMMVESEGYFAKEELERNARWADGSNYVFVLDTMGNQLITGSPARMDGKAPHEWGSRGGGRGSIRRTRPGRGRGHVRRSPCLLPELPSGDRSLPAEGRVPEAGRRAGGRGACRRRLLRRARLLRLGAELRGQLGDGRGGAQPERRQGVRRVRRGIRDGARHRRSPPGVQRRRALEAWADLRFRRRSRTVGRGCLRLRLSARPGPRGHALGRVDRRLRERLLLRAAPHHVAGR